MIQSITTPSAPAAHTAKAPATVRAGTVDRAAPFAGLANGAVLSGDASIVVATADDPHAPDRQDDAAKGNLLPAADQDVAASDAGWLAMILAAPTNTVSASGTLPLPPGGSTKATPVSPAPAAPPALSDASSSPAAVPIDAQSIGQFGVADGGLELPSTGPTAAPSPVFVLQPAPSQPAKPTPIVYQTSPLPTAVKSQPGLPASALAVAPAIVAASPSLPPAIAPAGEVFAAAIHAAENGQPDNARDGDPIALQQAASPLSSATGPGAVTAAADRGDASLDMRRDDWPSAMVDHIERLRDAADAADTRIRVVPDALGSIDVSLSRHDDGVRVALSAHQPATQLLLADARPQLTELAQMRGLRLTDAGIGSGSQGFADAQPRPQAQPTTPNIRTSAISPADERDPADDRVA